MYRITIDKARTLIGSIIRKDGVDYGTITEITTIASSYTKKFVAITDKGHRIDVGSIFRIMNQINGSEKHYPDGTSYSVRVMRSPKRKGSGMALTGKSEIDDTTQEYYENNLKNRSES